EHRGGEVRSQVQIGTQSFLWRPQAAAQFDRLGGAPSGLTGAKSAGRTGAILFFNPLVRRERTVAVCCALRQTGHFAGSRLAILRAAGGGGKQGRQQTECRAAL